MNDKYQSTDSLDFIIKANNRPEESFLLILDEMNLSHVERYFSDFLSIMESGNEIKLDTDGKVLPKSVRLSENLAVIGTVNVDETTYAFSPKVLDRANVIEFETIPVSKLFKGGDNSDVPSGSDLAFLEDLQAGTEVRKMSALTIRDSICTNQNNLEYMEKLITDLDSIQSVMNSIHLSFGFRTIDEIFRFMYVSWIYSGKGVFKNWKRFFDAQIKQKILPKIHGNLSIRDGLNDLLVICSGQYKESEEKIKTMIQTLEKQRYVSFNN